MMEQLIFASQGSTFTDHVQDPRCGVRTDRQGRGTCALGSLSVQDFLTQETHYRKIILHSLSRFVAACYATQRVTSGHGDDVIRTYRLYPTCTRDRAAMHHALGPRKVPAGFLNTKRLHVR